MKLIIDVPKDTYIKMKILSDCGMGSDAIKYILNGTPLEQIKAEIEQIADEEQKHDKKWAMGLRYAVKIINKYKAESEDKE